MDKYKEYELVEKCLLQIEQRLDWGSSKHWHNEVFQELSKNIQGKTNVLLSPTTLKRVWGKVSYNSAPSINTLNTLAKFAGYANWLDFKNKNAQTPTKIKKANFALSPLKILGAVAVVMVLLAFIFIEIPTNGTENEDFDFSKIEFSSRPITTGLPNSVVFDLDMKGLVSDSIYIQQYWDVTKTIQLKPKQRQATGQYYYPGYFRAKLLVDGGIKKEHDLFIKSEGWMGTIDFDPIPKYFAASELNRQHLKLPKEAITEIAVSEKPLVSSFHYVDELGDISGDDFLLETSFRNIYNDKWAVCSTAKIVILGTKGAMIIPFSIPGCVSEIGLMMNDVYLSGKENDLSMFGTNLSQLNKFTLNVKNKNVEILINDASIYSGHYNNSIGNIAGLRYRFLGAGEVEYLKLKNGSTNIPILDERFFAER